jgi:hypothetical protein
MMHSAAHSTAADQKHKHCALAVNPTFRRSTIRAADKSALPCADRCLVHAKARLNAAKEKI